MIQFSPTEDIIEVPGFMSDELAGSKKKSENLKREVQSIPLQNHCSSEEPKSMYVLKCIVMHFK